MYRSFLSQNERNVNAMKIITFIIDIIIISLYHTKHIRIV